jgi:hypothetical protein
MKPFFRFFPGLPLLAVFSGLHSLYAAVPTISHVRVEGSVVAGESATLRANVADADSDLDYVAFQVAGPGISGWATAGNADVSGASATAQLSWAPPSYGLYTISATVYDLGGSASAQGTFEVFVGRRVISNVTIGSGAARMFSENGEILTLETPSSANVIAQSGGNFILWSGGRVTLKPGFRAESGSFFWAAVDHDMDGYSDVEEMTDTDGDGMFDAWEVEHGLNPISADASGDLDNDGSTNLAEFLAGRNPNDRADAASLPSGIQLVIKTGASQYRGINTSTWQMSSVSSP